MNKALWLIVIAVLLGGCRGSGPVAEFTYAPTTVRAREEARFDASASRAPGGQILDWAWTFGDGASAQGISPTHSYTTAGSFTVTLVVTDDRGRQGQAQATLDVLPEENPPPPGGPRASFTAQPQQGQAPLTANFDASASTGDIVSYAWTFGDGATGSGVAVHHTYTAAGQYAVRLTVRDGAGREHSAQRTVTVESAPTPPPPGPLTAAFTFQPQRGPVPLRVNFDASASTGEITEYRWEFGDGKAATGKSVTHTFYALGQHTVRLTVVASDGRTATAEGQVTGEPPAPPPPPSGS